MNRLAGTVLMQAYGKVHYSVAVISSGLPFPTKETLDRTAEIE